MKKFKYFMFSLLLVGFITINCSGVSAASVTCVDTLPDTIKVGSIFGSFVSGTNVSNENISNYPFVALSEDGKYQLYCSDRNKGYIVPATVLSKGNRLNYGFVYIMMNSYPTKEVVGEVIPKVFADSSYTDYTGSNTYIDNMLDVWVTQMAIWGYQGSINRSGLSNDRGLSAVEATDQSVSFDYFKSFTDASTNDPFGAFGLWDTYVNPLITKAKSVKDPATVSLDIKVDGEWTKINNTNTIKSGMISVTADNSLAKLSNYSIAIQNAPEGTKVYNESGNDITNSISSIPAGTRVYLVVNKDNVSKDTKFIVSAKATATYDAAYQYIDKTANTQPSILVGPETKEITDSIEMTLSPDTGLSVSSSMYLLGFIILISGAFIIYANVKPKKQEN